MPNWEEIRNEWETTKITLVALAEKHDVKFGTLKRRKSRDKWSRGAPKKDATKKSEMVATQGASNNDATEKKLSSYVYRFWSHLKAHSFSQMVHSSPFKVHSFTFKVHSTIHYPK